MPPFQTQTIQLLLERAVEKAETTMDYSGLETLSNRINEVAQERLGVEISRKYLYDNVYCQIKKALQLRQEEVFLSRIHLNAIASFLGFRDVLQFLHQHGQRLHRNFHRPGKVNTPESGNESSFAATCQTPRKVDFKPQSQMGIANSGITVLGGTVSIHAQNIAGRDLVFQSPLG